MLGIPYEYTKQKISKLQRRDPDPCDLMTHFIDKHELNETDRSIWSPATRAYWALKDLLTTVEGVLCRKWLDVNDNIDRK